MYLRHSTTCASPPTPQQLYYQQRESSYLITPHPDLRIIYLPRSGSTSVTALKPVPKKPRCIYAFINFPWSRRTRRRRRNGCKKKQERRREICGARNECARARFDCVTRIAISRSISRREREENGKLLSACACVWLQESSERAEPCGRGILLNCAWWTLFFVYRGWGECDFLI